MRARQRVTIIDVAERAGVHAATVSRTLSRPDRVAVKTRERVMAAVDELGFTPNRAARGLITGKTGNVAVIVPDITNPHFGALVRAVERAARDADLQVLLVDTGEHSIEEVRGARALAGDVDGFVVVSARRLHKELDALESKPAAFVNRPVAGQASVLMRTATAMTDALQHLATFGHTRVAYLAGPARSWAAGERRAAVRKTGRARGITVVDVDVDVPTFEATVEAVDAIIAARVTAVLTFNDQMALGVMAGLSQAGLEVPRDVSLVGCDDVPMAAMVPPGLTTIHMPTAEAGAAAVALLDDGPRRVELSGTFVARGSTGPVTRRRATAGAKRGHRPSAVGSG